MEGSQRQEKHFENTQQAKDYAWQKLVDGFSVTLLLKGNEWWVIWTNPDEWCGEWQEIQA